MSGSRISPRATPSAAVCLTVVFVAVIVFTIARIPSRENAPPAHPAESDSSASPRPARSGDPAETAPPANLGVTDPSADAGVSTVALTPTESALETHTRRIDAILRAAPNRKGVEAVLTYLESLEADQVQAYVLGYAHAMLCSLFQQDPALLAWARGRMSAETSDLSQCVLMQALVSVGVVRGAYDAEERAGLAHELLDLYPVAQGPRTRRNLSSHLATFMDYSVVQSFLDSGSFDRPETVADLSALLGAMVANEASFAAARDAGNESLRRMDLRESSAEYVDLLIRIAAENDESEAILRECLQGVVEIRPASLGRFRSLVRSPPQSEEFVSWATRFIEARIDDEPNIPP